MAGFESRIVGEGTEAPDQLLANPFNYRRHPAEQLDALEGALEEIGWIQRVIVNRRTGHMIDGHARVKLALRRGEKEVPVLYVDLDEREEKIALAVLDPITGLAYHDDEQLAELLDGLEAENEALADFLGSMIDDKSPPDVDEDDAPEPDDDDEPVSKPGDIWALGNHLVMCGDSTSISDMRRLMGDDTADLVWTDPPYGVSYESKVSKVNKSSTRKTSTILNDDIQGEALYKFLLDAFSVAIEVTKPGGCIYVAHAESEGMTFRKALVDAGWLYKQALVWVKNAPVLSRQDYNWRHEQILYGWKDGAAHFFIEDFTNQTVLEQDELDIDAMKKDELADLIKRIIRAPSTIIEVDKPSKSDLHPTMKPVKLVAKLIHNSSRTGEIVLDPFGGSGTTLIASEQTGRVARIMELSPIYVDVIVRRWQEFTGNDAVHAEIGKTFDEIAAERG